MSVAKQAYFSSSVSQYKKEASSANVRISTLLERIMCPVSLYGIKTLGADGSVRLTPHISPVSL